MVFPRLPSISEPKCPGSHVTVQWAARTICVTAHLQLSAIGRRLAVPWLAFDRRAAHVVSAIGRVGEDRFCVSLSLTFSLTHTAHTHTHTHTPDTHTISLSLS